MAEFKPIAVNGIKPIIIDYNNFKITILMYRGVTIKFFKEHDNRWYKLKDIAYSFMEIDECIKYAKNCIDNDNTGYFEDRLRKQLSK